ncbi:MAG: hypothetical protein SOU19_01745 [Candidatus Caccosoma sp.]|nr:hypothetical protein [Candidatus Caccosoma sp.]
MGFNVEVLISSSLSKTNLIYSSCLTKLCFTVCTVDIKIADAYTPF